MGAQGHSRQRHRPRPVPDQRRLGKVDARTVDEKDRRRQLVHSLRRTRGAVKNYRLGPGKLGSIWNRQQQSVILKHTEGSRYEDLRLQFNDAAGRTVKDKQQN